jgi:Segregation and condensation complex subunit ScpB
MTAAARRRQRSGDESLDVELSALPPAARWREWMLRVEDPIFASPKPVARETLVRLVGDACRFDDLIADLIHELRGRPYDLTLVAGGYALRTITRVAPAIRAAHPGLCKDDLAKLTRTETFALTAISYLQPVTRGGRFRNWRDAKSVATSLLPSSDTGSSTARSASRNPGRRLRMSRRGNSWRRSGSQPYAICRISSGSRQKGRCGH